MKQQITRPKRNRRTREGDMEMGREIEREDGHRLFLRQSERVREIHVSALAHICSEACVPAAPVIAFFIGFREGSLEARDFVFNVPELRILCT